MSIFYGLVQNDLGFFLVEMASTEASLRLLLATFAFICPFCFAKYGLCGFDYRKKQTQIEKRFRSVMVEMAVIETASENQFPRISTSVVCLLRFPSESAGKQAHSYGIL